MMDDNAILVDAFRRHVADIATPEAIRSVEKTGAVATMWQGLSESGFLDAAVPEAAGGAGLGMPEIFPLLLALGEHIVPIPFGESMVARGMVSALGGDVPVGAMIALAPTSTLIPGGAYATHALIERDGLLALVPSSPTGDDIFGAGGTTALNLEEPIWSTPTTGEQLLLGAAATVSAQMAGAMARILDMTLRHASDRQQFGRALGKFQAIQQQVAVLAEQVISAQVAARMAFTGDRFDLARVAAAKCRTNEAANAACAIAHAVHGAIGATEEFDLQLYTRRLKQWQLAYGSESYWAVRLGQERQSSGLSSTADFLRLRLAHLEPTA